MSRINFLKVMIFVAVATIIMFPVYTIFFVYPSFTGRLLEEAETDAVYISRHLVSMLTNNGNDLKKEPVLSEFPDKFKMIRKDFNLAKIRFFSPDGEILYSTDAHEIGDVNIKKYFRELVAKGKVYSKAVKKDTKTLDGQTVTIDVVETYMPVMNNGKFIGAFEIYSDITKIKNRMNKVIFFSSAGLFGIASGLIAVVVISSLKASRSISEQKKAEEKIQKQNDFLKIIIDSIPHPFYVINSSDYTITLANKAAGAGDASSGKLTCYALSHKSDRPCGGDDHPCTLLEVKNTGKPVIFEHIHYDGSGRARNYEVHGYPVFDSGGNVAQVIEHSIDITERKLAEEQLRKMSRALEQSPNIVMITDTEGHIEHVNPKFTETTGYAPEEVIGKKPDMLKSGLTPPETYKELWDTITSGNVWHGELVNKKKDGAIYWEAVSVSPVKNPEGNITHFVAVKEDITERKLLYERFKQILSEHHIILENANIGIAYIKDRKVIHINKKCEELFGYQRHEIIGSSVEIFYPDYESYREFGEEAYGIMATGQSYSAERVMKNKDTYLFWCRLFGKAIDHSDMSKGAIWIIEDITNQKESEHKVRRQQQQLEELNKTLEKRVAEEVAKSLDKDRILMRQARLADLGTLAAGITHEINTPLTYIKGNLELLKMEINGIGAMPDEEANKLFRSIEDGIKRISTIIESMKHISGYSKKEKAPFNVFSTIIDAGRIVYNRSKHIAPIYINSRLFDITMDKDEEVFIAPVAAQSISQAWIIILNNAVDELLKTGRPFEKRYIKIEILKAYDKIKVVIKDNAGGIKEELLDKIFDMFVSTKPHSGTGLGLHIAKTIIEGHEGTIRAYNDESGAVFEIELKS